MADVATKKRIRLPRTIKNWPFSGRVMYSKGRKESETFGDVEKEFSNEGESDDAHTDEPFISCAEDGDETDGDD
ncbi:hypothetical protein JCM33374_g6109 [Metschnikowia sp. JCM 33374]|nr:hypothetical protein JCM33374_g6109 [Metschnikowia sp. JCM 33374]